MSMPSLLEAKNISKVFDIRQGFSSQAFYAVDNASFSLKADKPEIFSVAGESGSGKSTLAKMILGMHDSSEGSLTYKGKSIDELSNKEKRSWFYSEVQPVFQDPFAAFSPLKRIDHYLYETVSNYKVVPRSKADDYLNDVLLEVGLSITEIKGRYPKKRNPKR